MNNLKKYAGLLNDKAPKGEFLAYINENESKILKDAGATGLLTPQGIPSYRGGGEDAGAGGGGSGGGGGGGSGGGGGGGQDAGAGSGFGDGPSGGSPGGQDASRSDFNTTTNDPYGGGVGGVQTGLTTTTVDMSHYGDPDPEVDVPTSQREDTITSAKDNIVADFKSNPWGYTGLLGITFNSLNQLNKTNKARAMMGLDPIGGIADGSANNGDEGQGEGNSSNDLLNILAPTAPYLVGGTDAVPSEASKWYNSIGNNTKQFNFAESYATAKIKIGQTLNNKGPIGMLAVSQSPYYDWLKTNKLDRGIL
jgi:hypothetical protein